MLNELEKLSREDLIAIADKYHVYNATKMNKKELINSILIVSGEGKALEKKKDVKVKKTHGTTIYIWLFNLLILLLVTMTFAQYFTRFYFSGKIFAKGTDFYGLVLSFLSICWSCYVYYYWWKHKTFNIFFLFNILLSVGYFLHFMISYSQNIKILNASFILNPWTNIYKTLFYVWLGLAISISSGIGILLIIKKVKY